MKSLENGDVVCSYCLRSKPAAEMSDEHIWPEGLGGDPLGWPWRTSKVCGLCNNLAGQWVDAAFIKSWFGSHERHSGVEDYLDPAAPQKAVAPLIYMGVVEHEELKTEEVGEVWLGSAGDTILHVRPKHEAAWSTYAGGKPSKKRSESGHAYLAFASPSQFWAHVTLWSFQRHFKFATRTLANSNMPEMPSPLTPIDPNDTEQARHLRILRSLAGGIHVQMTIAVDFASRFLAKLALGIGRELLGEAFLQMPYARHLSAALWERDFEKRQAIPVRGSGFLGAFGDVLKTLPLAWPGAWVLIVMTTGGLPCLTVITPSGKAMTVLVSDAPDAHSAAAFPEDGLVYLAIPAAGRASGPIALPEYLAFMTGVAPNDKLQQLRGLRRDPAHLPPKR